jgi:hypothetical protein
MKKIGVFLAAVFLTASLPFCKKSSTDDNNSGNNNGGNNNGGNAGAFKITGTTPEHVFWGEEITINGTGFSTNAADYTFRFIANEPCIDSFKTQVISLTSSQLKIKAPIGQYTSGIPCGPNILNVVVTAGGKSDTTDNIKMVGWPRIIDVCSHYGGFAGNYFTPGDSAVLTLEGASGWYATVNNAHKNVKLRVGNDDVPFTWENFTSGCGLAGGAKVNLDVNKYAERKCPGDPGWNNGWRSLTFTAYVPGTNRMVAKNILVTWQPTDRFYNFSGPTTVSKSAGGPFQQWTINGRNMFFEKVRFTSLNCNVTPQEMTISSGNGFYNSITFDIPLSVLSADCTYNVSLITRCGDVQGVGNIRIVP